MQSLESVICKSLKKNLCCFVFLQLRQNICLPLFIHQRSVYNAIEDVLKIITRRGPFLNDQTVIKTRRVFKAVVNHWQW